MTNERLRYNTSVFIVLLLFVITPVIQSVLTRVAPFEVSMAMWIIVISAAFLPNDIKREYIKRFFGFFWPAGNTERVAVALLACFILWAIVSLLWSLAPLRGAKELGVVILMPLAVILISNGIRVVRFSQFGKLVTAGFILGCISIYLTGQNVDLVVYHFSENFERFDLNRNAVAISFLVFGVVCFKPKTMAYKIALLLASALVIWTIFVSESEAAKLAILFGGIAAGMVYFVPSLRKLIFLAMGVMLFVMPIMPQVIEQIVDLLPQEFARQGHIDHRLEIWKGYSNLSYQKPFLGWGMGSDFVLGTTDRLGDDLADKGYHSQAPSPHNAALEIWINLGVVGVLLLAAVLYMGHLMARKATVNFQSASTGAAVAIFTVAVVGSSLFQGWFLAAIVIAITLFMKLHGHNSKIEPRPN